ncbi:MAG: hypothetical protein ACRDWN_01475, partial [Acidimicrobiales bacterium]
AQLAGLIEALPRNLAYGLRALLEQKGGAPVGQPTADEPTADGPKPTADEPKPTADEPKPTADEPKPTADEAG